MQQQQTWITATLDVVLREKVFPWENWDSFQFSLEFSPTSNSNDTLIENERNCFFFLFLLVVLFPSWKRFRPFICPSVITTWISEIKMPNTFLFLHKSPLSFLFLFLIRLRIKLKWGLKILYLMALNDVYHFTWKILAVWCVCVCVCVYFINTGYYMAHTNTSL